MRSLYYHALKDPEDLNVLIDSIGDARIVLLGEASHGTSEYYTWRMKISKKLITEMGFNFIAVEGDWPDCYQVNRYIKNYPGYGKSAREVLKVFKRWPTWMWGNWEISALTEWLKAHNKDKVTEEMAGNVGQLVRERFGLQNAYAVGFGSYEGTVIAADMWGAPMEEMTVPEAAKGSWEAYLHSLNSENKLIFSTDIMAEPVLNKRIGHRAIGVVYHPEYEKSSNYVPSRISDRYDAFIYLDQTKALHPLSIREDYSQPPELYPWNY
jgi:erythromycin esterase-like protein